MNYPADGFSVVRGSAEQKQRLDKKKLWNNDYYALADGDNSFMQADGYFSWLERMGIYKSYGSYPGFDSQYRAKWERAKRLGLVLFADSSGDSNWLNDNLTDGQDFIAAAAPFTRFFKSTNEIDIRREGRVAKAARPAHWVQRAQWEYEQAHSSAATPITSVAVWCDRATGGGRTVVQTGVAARSGSITRTPGIFHAYPQQAPRFGGSIGNGESEDERGVLAAYASLRQKEHACRFGWARRVPRRCMV